MLHRYSLYIDLMHLQDPRAFWSLANDKRSYPNGFYKITFHLPHLNLERLRKVFDKVLVMSSAQRNRPYCAHNSCKDTK